MILYLMILVMMFSLLGKADSLMSLLAYGLVHMNKKTHRGENQTDSKKPFQLVASHTFATIL